MAISTYTYVVTVPSDVALDTSSSVLGQVTLLGTPTPVDFTAVIPKALGILTPVSFTASFAIPPNLTHIPSLASITFWPAPYLTSTLIAASLVSSDSGATSGSGIPTTSSNTSETGNTTIPQISSVASLVSPSAVTGAPSPSTTRHGDVSHGYSAGVLAGTAVGCAIGGALLVGLIALLVLRRHRARNGATRVVVDSGSVSNSSGEKQVAVSTGMSNTFGQGGKTWEHHLPQAESDQSVRSTVSRTFDQIEMHVENFYQDTTSRHLGASTDLAIREFDCGHLAGPVLNLMRSSSRPTSLIKHCLADMILSRIDLSTASGSSFLPNSMTALAHSPRAQTAPGFLQAFSRWRVISAYLRQDPDNDHTYLAERDVRIRTTATQFCEAFEPWARSQDSARFQNIVSIMQRASEMGVMLHSQAATFEWQWEVSTRATQRKDTPMLLVVLPGLYKILDENSERLSPPIHLTEPRLASKGSGEGDVA